MKLKIYPKYKPSGVEWLGDVPAGWGLQRITYLFERKKDTNHIGEELLSVYRDYGVVPKSSRDDNFNKPSEDLAPYQLVKIGDLVLNKMKTWQGSIAISEFQGIVSPAYFVAAPKQAMNLRFMHYLLRSVQYIAEYRRLSAGIRPNQWDLDFDNFKSIVALLPPLEDQSAVATFLDRETARIDTLIAKQKRLIELLQEKRQAVISEAVTRGLDPVVPTKPSGAEWLGDVPAHWHVSPLKSAVTIQEGPGIMADDFRDEGVPLLRIANVGSRYTTLEGCNYLDPDKVEKRWGHFRVRVGDLLISASASMGTVSEVTEGAAGSIPYTGLIRLVPEAERTTRAFIRYFVVSSAFLRQIDLLKAGATIQHFGPTHLRQVCMALPPINEQRSIGEYLDNANAKIDALIAKAQQAIELQKEHRIALISAAVTGKIDVRELAEQEVAEEKAA